MEHCYLKGKVKQFVLLFILTFAYLGMSAQKKDTAKIVRNPNPLGAIRAAKQPGENNKTTSIQDFKGLIKSISKVNDKDGVIDETNASKYPANSLQQYLKGKSAGLYIQEQSGEPGTDQFLFLRGTSSPLLSARDLQLTQPLIVVDGMPLISNEHPFAYDIQIYDFNRIGPATNLLAGVDLANIASVKVLKDISQIAMFGPRASNGVIYITTKAALVKKQISFDIYTGVATPNSVTTINGNFEKTFRQQFYNRYASQLQSQNYPAFLKDSLSSVYSGPSNWTDSYYSNAIVFGVNASVTGGSETANFKFSASTQSTGGVADKTGLNQYAASFTLNMKPQPWITITANVNAHKMERQRNRFMRDRLAEVRYMPDLSLPPSPNNAVYSNFLTEYDKSIDGNKSNLIDGFLNFALKLGKINFSSRLGVSYTEGYRDIFYPSTILDGFSYASNYFGYNQRLVLDNNASYTYEWNKVNKLDLEAGQSIQKDFYRYNYAYADGGSSDFIKVNLLNANLTSQNFRQQYVFRFLDQTANNLLSYKARATYTYNGLYSFSALLRSDGSSNAQPTNRWFVSPVVSASWDIKNGLLAPSKIISQLKLHASYGIIGRVELDDRLGQGPQYTVDVGWNEEPRIGAYSGISTLSRPYTSGFIGYNIPWTYTEQLDIGTDFGLFNDRIYVSADVYSKNTKNQVIGIPSNAEYGYTQALEPGMSVNNSGIELTLGVQVLSPNSKLQWTSSLNISYNKNILKALPGGLNQLVIGSRKLLVGKAVDQFWVLENVGMYYSDDEVPINPKTGKKMTYMGTVLRAGDPIWKDVNGDYAIDDNDKVLKGHTIPMVSGGYSNNFRFKNWDLGIDFYFNLGRNIINQQMANRFDFINREAANDMNSVTEITFWEKRGNYNLYPRYNPWSAVTPYRIDQDLFLENGSFLKLRTVSLGYDLLPFIKKRSKTADITKLYVYATANNLFTLTPYTGGDPELVDYTGFDTGYGLPLSRTFTFGIKVIL